MPSYPEEAAQPIPTPPPVPQPGPETILEPPRAPQPAAALCLASHQDCLHGAGRCDVVYRHGGLHHCSACGALFPD